MDTQGLGKEKEESVCNCRLLSLLGFCGDILEAGPVTTEEGRRFHQGQAQFICLSDRIAKLVDQGKATDGV